jgi:hypothetical protein
MAREYEFNQGENAVFSSLASGMKFVGIALMVLGALSILLALAGDFGAAVSGVIYLLIGIWTRSAANSIRAIVDTEGSDIMHLMNAMGDLKKLYTLQKWALIIGMIGIVLLIVFGLVASS